MGSRWPHAGWLLADLAGGGLICPLGCRAVPSVAERVVPVELGGIRRPGSREPSRVSPSASPCCGAGRRTRERPCHRRARSASARRWGIARRAQEARPPVNASGSSRSSGRGPMRRPPRKRAQPQRAARQRHALLLPATGASSERLYWESLARPSCRWSRCRPAARYSPRKPCPSLVALPSGASATCVAGTSSTAAHFAALKQPTLLVDELLTFFREVR